jgi:heterotetrameric sarcosine oxidase delta subunit
LLIVCPHCGPRNSNEFSFLGERSSRPTANEPTPAEWRRYLYTKDNAAGLETERWFHGSGCRRFLDVERDTVTNEIRAVRDAAEVAR